jgi:DNA-binding NarL/FixJ family response regulator
MDQPRILLADDHPDVLLALQSLLSELGEVVGTVTDGIALVEAAHRLTPDLIIADLSMPGLSGLEATRALRRSMPDSKVIILTVHRSPVYAALAFDAGACGYVLKRTAVAELSQAVLHVLSGDRYVGQGVDVNGACGSPRETSL